MSTEIDAARLLVYRAAWLKEQGGRTEEGRRRSSSRRRWRGARRRRRSRSSAATAIRRSSRSSASTATRRSRRSTRHERDPAARHREVVLELKKHAGGGRLDTYLTLVADRPRAGGGTARLYPERLPENIPLSLTLLYPFARWTRWTAIARRCGRSSPPTSRSGSSSTGWSNGTRAARSTRLRLRRSPCAG